jgi:hypothetical protein
MKTVLAALLFVSSSVFAADVAVTVESCGEGFCIEAKFDAPVQPQVAFEVLTDFGNMPKFLKSLSASRIEKRDGNKLEVFQSGVTKAGWFSINYESRRQIELFPDRFEVTTVATDNGRMNSSSVVRGSGANSTVVYRAKWEPDSALAKNFGAGSCKNSVESQFSAMRAEMLRRSSIVVAEVSK